MPFLIEFGRKKRKEKGERYIEGPFFLVRIYGK